jgi:hypothetical protein
VVKEWGACDVRWALSFPDTYEIGMSNLGLAICTTSSIARRACLPNGVRAVG